MTSIFDQQRALHERFKGLGRKLRARDEIRIRSPAPLLYPRFTRPGHRVRDCPNKDSNSAPVPIQEKKPLPKETQKTSAPKLFPDAPDDPAKRYRYYLAIAERKRNSRTRNPEPETTPDPEPTKSSGLESGTSELISGLNPKPATAISESDDTGSESTITKPLTDSEDLEPEPTSDPEPEDSVEIRGSKEPSNSEIDELSDLIADTPEPNKPITTEPAKPIETQKVIILEPPLYDKPTETKRTDTVQDEVIDEEEYKEAKEEEVISDRET
ncbi:hypothetical protein MPER_12964 [Moniliophthora perniciosa FA553]|nr:hypothetical protein MPER_12964 [Moniliophthora perniciosa FA553]